MFTQDKTQWLPLDAAAKHLGYSHPESLRRRLRQLRQRGLVIDLGQPPSGYPVRNNVQKTKAVVVMWANPKTALIRSDVSPELLNPKRGKRAKLQR